MVNSTSGCAICSGVVSAATIGSAVGMAAIRRCPASPRFNARISCRIARVSPTIRRAQSSTRTPSGVKPRKRDRRRTSNTPRLSSSCFKPAESVGCVTPHASAARPKCCSRAKASIISSLSIIPEIFAANARRVNGLLIFLWVEGVRPAESPTGRFEEVDDVHASRPTASDCGDLSRKRQGRFQEEVAGGRSIRGPAYLLRPGVGLTLRAHWR